MMLALATRVSRAARCCAVAGLAALASSVAAQTVPETVPTIDLTPMLETIAPPVASTDAVPTAPAPMPQLDRSVADESAPPAPKATILPLQSQGTARILRISGETGAAQLFLDLPDVAAVDAFSLSYRTSVDILPERSQLRITVNGTETDPVTPVSSDGFQKLVLPVSLLVRGRNEIDISATQAHRIFCGPEASFQIWSEFDLNASGVNLKAASFALNEAWLKAALMAQAVSGTGVPLRGSEGLSKTAMEDIAVRLSGVDAGGWLRHDTGYGPATASHDLMRINVIPGSAPGATLRQGADGVIVLAVVPQLDGTLPAALDSFLPEPLPIPDLPAVEPGTTATLASLGFSDTSDESHYIRHDLRFRLPSDWLILKSERAALTLLYRFPASLPKGSILLVKINGTTLELLPLDENGGQALPPHPITFPARLLHPGVNELTFEATVPGDPADLPCATSSGAFLTLMAESDLTVPTAPLMQFPGVGPALLGLSQAGIAVPTAPSAHSDDLAQATELALMTQLRPVEGQSADPDAGLSIVSLQTADQVPLDDLGLTLRDLTTILPGVSGVVAKVAKPAARVPFGQSVQLVTSVQQFARQVEGIARPGDPDLRQWLEKRSGQAVLIMPKADDPSKLWLVVGPSADPVQVARALAEARLDPYGPRGQVAILTDKGVWQDWQPAATAPLLQEPLTLTNFRFVAGTFASWSPLYFVVLLFGVTAVSVLLGLIFVVTTRGGRKL